MTSREPVLGPCAWRGADMATSSRWIRTFEAADIAEIDAALRRTQARGISWQETTTENFPLDRLRAKLADIGDELEEGCGMVKLRGLPVERYEPLELRQIWFGIGNHVGRPVYQNFRGELMREIKDEGAGVGERYGQLERDQEKGGVFLSSYARTLSNGALRFHTDRCDVVGLLCVRQADTGGRSLLCSSVAVHNEMLRRRPDLVDALFENVYRSRLGEEKGGAEQAYALPIFGVRDGKFTSHYSLTYIEAAQLMPGLPRLTAAQSEALVLLTDLAKELSFEMTLEPGDMQFLNNHVIYHARTPFTDDAAAGRNRLLYRIWLTTPNSRALPEGHEVLWRSIEAGVPRGGIGQATTD
jgi:TfdA family taurine catabolism dioxygenase TauD